MAAVYLHLRQSYNGSLSHEFNPAVMKLNKLYSDWYSWCYEIDFRQDYGELVDNRLYAVEILSNIDLEVYMHGPREWYNIGSGTQAIGLWGLAYKCEIFQFDKCS